MQKNIVVFNETPVTQNKPQGWVVRVRKHNDKEIAGYGVWITDNGEPKFIEVAMHTNCLKNLLEVKREKLDSLGVPADENYFIIPADAKLSVKVIKSGPSRFRVPLIVPVDDENPQMFIGAAAFSSMPNMVTKTAKDNKDIIRATSEDEVIKSFVSSDRKTLVFIATDPSTVANKSVVVNVVYGAAGSKEIVQVDASLGLMTGPQTTIGKPEEAEVEQQTEFVKFKNTMCLSVAEQRRHRAIKQRKKKGEKK